MTVDELVKKELLKKVIVNRTSNAITNAGNIRYTNVFENNMSPLSPKRMSGMDCACNSICVVEVMREKGEDDWQIVPGFAFNPDEKDPIAHVWIRKGSAHYDPTWSLPCFNWEFKDLRHYPLVQPLSVEPMETEKDTLQKTIKWGNDILRELKSLAEKWNMKLAGQLE